MICKICCKNETNNPDGICDDCKVSIISEDDIPPNLDKKIQDSIRSKLKNGFIPPTELLMYENALGLHARGRYRDAVIEIISAFDIFLVNFLIKKYNEKGFDNTLIDFLKDRCKDFHFMLKDGFKIAVKKSFPEIDNNLFKDFTQNILPLRNDIIHRGKKVTDKLSKNAIQTIDQMMYIISRL